VTTAHEVLVVSFRGPVSHVEGPDGPVAQPASSGGLVTGLLGLVGLPGAQEMRSWVCAARSDADREAVRRAAGQPFPVDVRGNEVSVRMVALDPEQERLTSTVAANPLLWFLHHSIGDLARSPSYGDEEHAALEAYAAVNAQLGDAVVAELDRLGPSTVVMLQDYHLYLVAPHVRQRRPDALLHHFVHVPWPGADAWRALPRAVAESLVRGLLANDVVGFHTSGYVESCLATCEQLPGLTVDREAGHVMVGERRVAVRAYPLSPRREALEAIAASPQALAERAALQATRPEQLVLRVDRADPTKNLLRGFEAWERLLEQHPEHQGRAVMLALLEPSRTEIAHYRDHLTEVVAAAAHLNARLGTRTWQPVVLDVGQGQERAVAAYQEFDVLLVNPVRDGMNLVAKEGVLLNERDGVLVLSEEAGAYEELGEHVLGIHPLDVRATAEALHRALTMPAPERRSRLQAAREVVEAYDAEQWFHDQVLDVRLRRALAVPAARSATEPPARPPLRRLRRG
jgi:trehalose 6-phosphate synthase